MFSYLKVAEYFIKEFSKIETVQMRQLGLEEFINYGGQARIAAFTILGIYVENKSVQQNLTFEEVCNAILSSQYMVAELISFS